MNLNWLYTAVSWILLRWHDLFSFLDDVTFLGTSWSWILAIVFLVITVRIVLFPLFVKQIKSQRAMQALQPQLAALREKHKGDKETLQRETMELMRKEKANPLMGCLPLVLQIPVFISLFWILGRRMDPGRVDQVNSGEVALADSNIELYGWTFDQYDSATHATLFNAPIAAAFFDRFFDRDLSAVLESSGSSMLYVRLVAGILTIVMVVTTFLTTRQMITRTGWATDPQQLMMQRLMVYGIPGMLLFSGAFFPISVILYWVVNNGFSLAQQQWVLRKYPPPKAAAAAANGKGAPTGNQAADRYRSGGRAGAGKSGKDGKGGKDGKSGKSGEAEKPAVDGKQLAPKPGAKPVQQKKIPSKRVPPSKKPPSANIPPKRKK